MWKVFLCFRDLRKNMHTLGMINIHEVPRVAFNCKVSESHESLEI